MLRGFNRAVQALDADRPDWFNRIDINKLDMKTTRCCVLGQVYESESGFFSDGFDVGSRRMPAKTVLAFCALSRAGEKRLRSRWISVIESRRAASVAPQARPEPLVHVDVVEVAEDILRKVAV